MERNSPMPNPRIIGLVYLTYFVLAGLGDSFIKRVVVADPTTTISHLLAHEATYRVGFAIGMIANMTYVALTALFYHLLRPVDRTVALLMPFFSLIGCITQIIAGLLELAPLAILGNGQMAGAFQAEQVRAIAMTCLRVYSQAYYISFVQFGVFDFTLGYLIYRSTFLPRICGVLMMMAGVIAMAFLYPPLAMAYKWIVFLSAGLPEVVLALWLVIKGVNVARWEARALG